MTWAITFAETRGSVEFALLIHGLPQLWNTGNTWPTSIAGIVGTLAPVANSLKRDNLEWTVEADFKNGDLKHSDMTFHLVDGYSTTAGGAAADVTKHVVSDVLGRGRAGVTITEARGTLNSTDAGGGTAIQVLDASSFTSPGDAYMDLETLGYITATVVPAPDELQTLTRAKYGSAAAVHTYSVDAGDVRPEGDTVPLVSQKPISSYGRRCTLYRAVVQSDGTLETPEIVYRGRLMGGVKLTEDATTWELPTQSVWEALDTKIPARDISTELRGLTFQSSCRFDWDVAGGGATGNFTMTTLQWNSGSELMRSFMDDLNDDLDAAGRDEIIDWTIHDDGRAVLQLIDGAGAITQLQITAHNAAWAIALGFHDDNPWHRGVIEWGFTTEASQDVWPAVCGFMFETAMEPMTIEVTDAARFAAVDFNDEADSVAIQSYVLAGNRLWELLAVDVTNDTLDIESTGGMSAFGDGWAGMDRYYQRPGEAPIEIQQVLILRGSWWQCWKHLIEETTLTQEWRGYMETGDFDWTGIEAAGGPDIARERAIFHPTSFRDMFLEDIGVEGLVPTISSGLVSAIPLHHPVECETDLAITEDMIQEVVAPGWVRSEERIISQLEYNWRWDWTTDGWAGPTVQIPFLSAEQRFGDVNSRTIENRGLDWRSNEDIATVFANAQKYLEIFSEPYPVIELVCTIRCAGLLPGNTVTLTDPRIPDLTSGTRGVTALRCLVLGITVAPYQTGRQVKLTLLQISDGIRRSGFAPAAELTGYVDNGAPAGDARHELTLNVGQYDDINEGLNFAAGMRVLLYESNSEAPVTENHIVSPAGSNAAGTSIYITAAPVAAVPGVLDRVRLNAYDTAGQIAQAQGYVHVCNDADNLIGTTSDDGFKLA